MNEKKVGPTDFEAEIERLKAAGKLPTLEEVLDAIAGARQEFAPKRIKLVKELATPILNSDHDNTDE